MKYRNESIVEAVYSCESGNPYAEALPEMLGREEFMERMRGRLPALLDLDRMQPQERRAELVRLSSWFYPLDYMYVLYDLLYRAMAGTYQTQTVTGAVRQMNTIYLDFRNGRERERPYGSQGFSGAVLGVPGIGKTSTIRRCLSTMPQVITHKSYQGRKMYEKQINYLIVECPSDCSVKTLAFNILSAIDRAIGSDYFNQAVMMKHLAGSALSTKLKIICMNHHIGLIVIDEIQNAVLTAAKNRQERPLIRFLVELTNETATGICFCGTLEAEELFGRQEHLKRRTRGLRLLPMRYDITYRKFITALWENRLTLEKVPLPEKLMKQVYDLSGGIPAYMVRIFAEAQAQAILSGREKITYETIREAVEVQGIEVPRNYSRGGRSISDFTVEETETEVIGEDEDVEAEPASADVSAEKTVFLDVPMEEADPAPADVSAEKTVFPDVSMEEVCSADAGAETMPSLQLFPAETKNPEDGPGRRFYATKRGRPGKERSRTDLVLLWKREGRNILSVLEKTQLAERRRTG